MVGSNNRPPAWAPPRLMDMTSKTDGLDIAWNLARRIDPEDPLGVLASEAQALGNHVPALATCGKQLKAFHEQLKAGHHEQCFQKRRDNGFLRPGWKRCTGGWKCHPDCKASLPEA